MDNYFTSCSLATDLLNLRTTIVGTIRKNRTDIPKELLPSRARPEMSSIFCFDNQLTLTSYVPKKGKAVILLSSMHHDDTVDAEDRQKPEIIQHYNKTKSGVDNLDHLVGLYSVKRKVRRWPMTLFFNIIDVAYVSWLARNPDWNVNKTHKRRLFLRDLSEVFSSRAPSESMPKSSSYAGSSETCIQGHWFSNTCCSTGRRTTSSR